MMLSEILCVYSICFIIVLSSLASVRAGRSVNYCGAKMCGHTDDHTFCQYNEGPGPNCVGYMEAPLSVEEKTRVLVRLNQRRAAAAAGRLKGFPPAANMLKLRWVEELSREAQRWADQCASPSTPEENDSCRDLYSVPVGQSVVSVVGEAPGLRIESLVDIWYMQNMFYKGNVTAYQPPNPSATTNNYGDFAQILWARAYLVGCGRSRFMVVPPHGRMRSVERLVCNIAPRGPPAGRPLWVPGGPASACSPRARPDPSMPELCIYQDILDDSFDADESVTVEENILLDTILTIERDESLDHIGGIDELYLTRIAIATLQNETSSEYNTMQKRDIDTPLDKDIVMLKVIQLDNDVVPSIGTKQDATNQSQEITSPTEAMESKAKKVTRIPIEKVSIVGRPKSYNIEELNIENEVKETENPNDLPRPEISDKTKEIYDDYEYSVSSEESEMTILATTATSVPEINTSYENTTLATFTPLSTPSQTLASFIDVNGINETAMFEMDLSGFIGSRNTNITALLRYFNETTNETINEKAIADYLSDPETVKQLQDELDRMEAELSSSTTQESAGKSRREISRTPQEILGIAHENHYQATEMYTTLSEVDRKIRELMSDDHDQRDKEHDDEQLQLNPNNSAQSTPFLNMAFKYMPKYFKDYEQVIRKRTSKVNRNQGSYSCLVVTLFVSCLC